jgi:hypothetical protein
MLANHSRRSWTWFVAWMTPGVCLAFGVTALGIFTLPVGVLIVAVLRLRRPTAEAWGLLAGIGAIVAWIGSLNLDYRACTTSNAGHLTLTVAGRSSTTYSCGGVNGLPWLIVGGCAAGVAILAYVLMTRLRMNDGKPVNAAPLIG